MSVLTKIAYYQNRRDEKPNQDLASQLAESEDRDGIQEIAENLWNKEPKVQNDCLKVLYEIGYLKPHLISDFTGDFLKLLKNPHNRLVWGGMIALSTIAVLQADQLFPHTGSIQKTMETGSVITRDAAVLTLARIASQKSEYNQVIFPFLLDHLQNCRPKDVPQHAEKVFLAVDSNNKQDFISVLANRLESLQVPQLKRVKKIIDKAMDIS